MSIRDRRNSVLKSSISINAIGDSITNFGKGVAKSIKTANEIVKQTNKGNVFKRTLIGKDNSYFRKRQENIRRKDREDEIESSTVQGVTKKQGNVVSRSTKGFLGRILDFFGIVLLGWFVNVLPGILKSLRGLIKKIGELVGILTNFVNGIKDFLVNIGTDIQNLFSSFPKFDFGQARSEVDKAGDESLGGLARLRQDMNLAVYDLNQPENIGLDPNDPEGLLDFPTNADEAQQQNKEGDDAPPTESADAPTKEGDKDKSITPQKVETASVGKLQGVDDDKIGDKVQRELETNDVVKGLASKQAQSAGETIENKISQENEEKDDDKDFDVLIDGIDDKVTEIVGTKGKRESSDLKANNEKDLVGDGKESLKGDADNFKGLSQFKIARSLLNPFKKKNKDAESITPNTKNRSSLKRNKKTNGTTVVIVEKAVPMNGQTQMSSGGGSKNGLNITDKTKDEKKIVQKYSSLALNQ